MPGNYNFFSDALHLKPTSGIHNPYVDTSGSRNYTREYLNEMTSLSQQITGYIYGNRPQTSVDNALPEQSYQRYPSDMHKSLMSAASNFSVAPHRLEPRYPNTGDASGLVDDRNTAPNQYNAFGKQPNIATSENYFQKDPERIAPAHSTKVSTFDNRLKMVTDPTNIVKEVYQKEPERVIQTQSPKMSPPKRSTAVVTDSMNIPKEVSSKQPQNYSVSDEIQNIIGEMRSAKAMKRGARKVIQSNKNPVKKDETFPWNNVYEKKQTDHFQKETDQFQKETDQSQNETDHSQKETDQYVSETDHSFNETDQSHNETDQSLSETDQSQKETDEAEKEADQPEKDAVEDGEVKENTDPEEVPDEKPDSQKEKEAAKVDAASFASTSSESNKDEFKDNETVMNGNTYKVLNNNEIMVFRNHVKTSTADLSADKTDDKKVITKRPAAPLIIKIDPKKLKTQPGSSGTDKGTVILQNSSKIKAITGKLFRNKKGRFFKKGVGKRIIIKKAIKKTGTDEDGNETSQEIYVVPISKRKGPSYTDDKPVAYVRDKDECANCLITSVATLPSELYLGLSNDDKHGLSVFCKIKIQEGTQFGPVIGEDLEFRDITPDMDFQHIWYAARDKEWKDLKFISTRDESKSNWCRYLRPSFDKDCNLICIIRGQSLYFMSRRNIKVGEELVYYMRFFEEMKRANSGMPSLPVHKESRDENTCGPCKITFPTGVNYIKHCQIYHTFKGAQIRSQCRVCRETFFTKKELNNHVLTFHDGAGGEFVCAICGRAYVYQNRLKAHMSDAHNEEPMECDECGKTYLNPQKLRNHKHRSHSKETWQCEKCLKFFSNSHVLKKHKLIHEEKYTVSCDRCGKLFRDKNNMKVHLLTHSGIKPFQCRERGCTAAFTVKQCLQSHYRKTHGYRDENMPHIDRCVPFTTDAYMGQEEPEEMQLDQSLLRALTEF